MKGYQVQLYAVVRVKVPVQAESQEEAITAAIEKVWGDRLDRGAPPLYKLFNRDFPCPEVVYTEFAEEVLRYLVDEDDDEDFERSEFYIDNPAPNAYKPYIIEPER